MSSIIHTKKYKITLFQVGLSDGYSGFYNTMNLLSYSSTNFIRYNSVIDMSWFNTEKNCFYGKNDGYYTKSEKAQLGFQTLIVNIVTFAKQNEGKTIMVSTNLNRGFKTNYNLDSIHNQKIKLIYIIDEIKKYPNVELNLVGHSQGGLVNLEAAIDRNTKINKIISISTPYSPVYLGEKLIFLDFFFKLGGQSAYMLFLDTPEEVEAYKASVKTLCSSEYFSNLKCRWNGLSSRPELIVITGTAGHLYNVRTNVSSDPMLSYNTITKQPFDGLVKFSEQTNIEHAKFIHLVDKNVPCYNEKKYADSICYYQEGFIRTCKDKCTLSSISFTNAVVDALFNLIDIIIKKDEIDDFSDCDVVKSIYAGLKRQIDNVPSGYEDYFNIYSNDYNHKYLRYNKETIAHLIALLD